MLFPVIQVALLLVKHHMYLKTDQDSFAKLHLCLVFLGSLCTFFVLVNKSILGMMFNLADDPFLGHCVLVARFLLFSLNKIEPENFSF